MIDTKHISRPEPTAQDREVVYRLRQLEHCLFPEQKEAVELWRNTGAVGPETAWLEAHARLVAELRPLVLAQLLDGDMLQSAYRLVEEHLLRCGVSSIIHKLTPGRSHMSWAVRVFSELRTVALPDAGTLYEAVDGSLAQAYRARNYNMEMSEEERAAQRVSFVYGNLAIDRPEVTKELVERVARITNVGDSDVTLADAAFSEENRFAIPGGKE